jgi:hypothetical protein
LLDSLGTSLKVYANLGTYDLQGDQHNLTIPSVQVSLSPPQDKISISPGQVKATVIINAAKAQYTIQNLPIYVEETPETLKNYTLEITSGQSETIPKLTVTGPQQAINQLINNTFIPKAVLDVIPEDSTNGKTTKPLHYELPEGVTVSPNEPEQKVEFTLTHN